MVGIGLVLLLEAGNEDGFLLEDGSGVLLLEAPDINWQNFYGVRVGDGMSTGERIR